MAHAQKLDFVFRRNGRVHVTWRGRQFSRLLAAEVCGSAVLERLCSVFVGGMLDTHSILLLPLHSFSHVSLCAISSLTALCLVSFPGVKKLGHGINQLLPHSPAPLLVLRLCVVRATPPPALCACMSYYRMSFEQYVICNKLQVFPLPSGKSWKSRITISFVFFKNVFTSSKTVCSGWTGIIPWLTHHSSV
jgi:hypothetical protein